MTVWRNYYYFLWKSLKESKRFKRDFRHNLAFPHRSTLLALLFPFSPLSALSSSCCLSVTPFTSGAQRVWPHLLSLKPRDFLLRLQFSLLPFQRLLSHHFFCLALAPFLLPHTRTHFADVTALLFVLPLKLHYYLVRLRVCLGHKAPIVVN